MKYLVKIQVQVHKNKKNPSSERISTHFALSRLNEGWICKPTKNLRNCTKDLKQLIDILEKDQDVNIKQTLLRKKLNHISCHKESYIRKTPLRHSTIRTIRS